MKKGNLGACALAASLFVGPWAALPAAGEGPELVKDIAPGPALAGGSFLSLPVSFRGRGYFAADDGFLGDELWSTDGTRGGTRRVADLCPGRCGSNSMSFTAAGDFLFFVAANTTSGVDSYWVWRSDGTNEGTFPLANLETGGLGSFLPLSYLAPFGRGVVFLVHERHRDAWDLWFSDGTRAGTRRIAPLPGRFDPVNPPFDNDWPRVKDEPGLHYFAWQGSLWATDGTAAGTRPVATPIVPCTLAWARLGGLVVYGGEDGRETCEPWVSDGTRRGTHRLRDIVAGDRASFPGDFVTAGNRIYFTALDEAGHRVLWKTDGSTRGTVPVRAAGLARGLGRAEIVSAVGSRLYFAANDGAQGLELWRTEGTPESTVRIIDLSPGPADTQFSYATPRGRQLFFTAMPSGAASYGLYVTEGTAESTVRLADSDSPVALGIGGLVFFVGHPGGQARGLGVTDGTVAGTRVFGLARPVRSSDPRQLTATPGGLVFSVGGPEAGGEIWRTGGNGQDTEPLPGVASGTFPEARLYPGIGGAFYYIFDEDRLGWTDGLTSREILPPGSIGNPVGLTERDGRAIFLARRPTGGGEEVWVWGSDGTPEGTTAVVRATNVFAPFPFSFRIWTAEPDEGGLRYLVQDIPGAFPDFLSNLSETDGTAAGTRGLVRIPVPTKFVVHDLVAAGRNVFALFDDRSQRQALWASDGTAEGTRAVLTGPGRERISIFEGLVAAGDQVFFPVDTAATGVELWASDGTREGTRRVMDLAPGATSSYPSDFAALGDRLLFSADDGEHGRELWITDGTPSGTRRLEIRPGPQGSYPQAIRTIGDRAVFAADDGAHGLEIWTTDGTPEGTRLAADVQRGPKGSSPRGFEIFGDELFFSAGRPREGYELWKLPLAVVAPR
ncbi:MAG TPA: hypothetical protein VGS22_08675 [Thermoanaerobaculia bacterium]|jgi:ELWxxDGT repeat protein|nr:hypothetical protein [Thermoanaerobaculia bacterium]